MFLVWASCWERVWFFCLHIVIKSTVQPVGLLGAYSTEAARSTEAETALTPCDLRPGAATPVPQGGGRHQQPLSRRRSASQRRALPAQGQRHARPTCGDLAPARCCRTLSFIKCLYPASPPPTGAVRHFRRTPSVIGFVTSCRYRCGRCGSWPPVLRFSGSPPPLLSSLPPSPSLGGCRSPVADSQTHPCPFPDLGAT